MITLPSSRGFASTIVQLGELDRSADRPARIARLRNVYAIEAHLFRDILIREWRRADRFDQSFVLVLVESTSTVTGWDEIIQSLARLTHDTDVIGWFERDRVLGLLWLDRDAPNAFAQREIENKVREELTRSAHGTAGLSITVHVPRVAEALCGGSPADPVFEELRESQGHPAIRDAAKRILDVVGSVWLLVILLPLLALITVLVKLTSSGPIFFRQDRIGASGKPFTMLKFRTMRVDADHELHRQFVTEFIKSGAAASPAGDSGLFKIVNDPRVTFVGRLLRKTSLDELPQLLNVLRGDMSLVGPRPPLSYEVEQYKRWHYRRVLEAKPGITGLWQVAGRSRTNFDDMVRLDLQYVQNQSAWTDIKILLATPRAVISGKGAC
jgi:lipopolysaccharide/colanic/teichoic acid biosynthesis glycosyltransferase